MLVVTKLIKRRFRSALQFYIDQYKAENSNTSSSNDDDSNVIFLETPIPGIAPIREILTVTREEHLMHDVIAQSDPSHEATNEYEHHNYSISFEPVNCKSKVDCSLHFAEVEILPEPETFIVGASRYDEEVIKINKKQREHRKRVKELKMMKTYLEALQIMNITYEVLDFGAMLDDDYIRAAALEELELEKKEEQEKKEKKNPLNP